jgi:hypothetical protein
MGIPLMAGRGFEPTDTRESNPVGIVNEAMSEVLWPGDSPIGKRLRPREDAPWLEVVGLASNVHHRGLRIEVEPKLYLPAEQAARATSAWILRIRGDVATTVELARAAVVAQSPTTPVRGVQVLEDTISDSVAVPRFRTVFVVGLALLAALLALIGVYGVVSFAVTQRTREIGVRMALGASADGVVREVVASGLRLAVAGVAVGALIAWPAAAVLGDFLFDVIPTDVATFSVIAIAITLVSGGAAYFPARKAATVDPVSVLSSE